MQFKDVVKEKYGEAARRVASGGVNGCCDPITSNLYDKEQSGQIPEAASRASLGCGNPTALAELKPGETVLDLGSGGGIDVLLSARRVGPAGKAYGLDMTEDMLALARENQRNRAWKTSNFSKGKSSRSRCPTTAWTSLFPIAS